jgi:hypothetical protein
VEVEAEEREDQHRDVVEELQKEELPAQEQLDEHEPVEQKSTRYSTIVGLTKAAFEGVEIEDALERVEDLSVEEREALADLVDIVRGRDRETRIVYAEQRLSRLNRVLAVLQPVLAVGLSPELADLRASYDGLVEDVTTLRESLEKLVDAQEEMFEQDRKLAEVTPEDGAGDDEPAPDADADAEPEPELPSTLYGAPGEPEPATPAAPRSTVWPAEPGERGEG